MILLNTHNHSDRYIQSDSSSFSEADIDPPEVLSQEICMSDSDRLGTPEDDCDDEFFSTSEQIIPEKENPFNVS